MESIKFLDLRDDWYRGADLMARLLSRSAAGSPVEFVGFPAQWVPMFVHFGAQFSGPSLPAKYIPLASDLPLDLLHAAVRSSAAQGRLRQLVEAYAAVDPLLADVLHKLDRRLGASGPASCGSVPLTGWQSYGRPEVLAFMAEIRAHSGPRRKVAVVLPCARSRPYDKSKTHKRIWLSLKERGIEHENVDAIVVSSIGVVPQPLWVHPVAIAYDSGVPDIYRILRLIREFFKARPYEQLIDCLEFQPYSDCLGIVHREGLISGLTLGPKRRAKLLPAP